MHSPCWGAGGGGESCSRAVQRPERRWQNRHLLGSSALTPPPPQTVPAGSQLLFPGPGCWKLRSGESDRVSPSPSGLHWLAGRRAGALQGPWALKASVGPLSQGPGSSLVHGGGEGRGDARVARSSFLWVQIPTSGGGQSLGSGGLERAKRALSARQGAAGSQGGGRGGPEGLLGGGDFRSPPARLPLRAGKGHRRTAAWSASRGRQRGWPWLRVRRPGCKEASRSGDPAPQPSPPQPAGRREGARPLRRHLRRGRSPSPSGDRLAGDWLRAGGAGGPGRARRPLAARPTEPGQAEVRHTVPVALGAPRRRPLRCCSRGQDAASGAERPLPGGAAAAAARRPKAAPSRASRHAPARRSHGPRWAARRAEASQEPGRAPPQSGQVKAPRGGGRVSAACAAPPLLPGR